jgi:site-specific DNA recombinase
VSAPSSVSPAGGSRGLAEWAEATGRRRGEVAGRGGLRFAFYGRVSTEDHQDPVTSRARRLSLATGLVAGYGRVVAEFFDAGQSRTIPWARRPEAARLVTAMADPDRGFDAIVVGEYDRAFYGGQYGQMAPLFEHYDLQLWTPEAGGPVDFAAADHELLMVAMGLAAKREITRTRIRVRTAMAAQTLEQGRYLGGRPPYGYRLADAGPHPNKAQAAWGRRAHRLDPDPQTAPVVAWMFAERIGGRSAARIARAMNESAIPCPSASDPARNPHRTGNGWTVHTVAAILANPRYTGRQVRNRQRTDRDLVDPANTGLGHRDVQRWNLPEGWVISRKPAHPAIVSEADYVAAQQASAPRGPVGPATRRYLLAGLISCRIRPPAGISVVQRQACLPLPPRAQELQPARPRPAQELLCPRGADPAPPRRARHPARRPATPAAAWPRAASRRATAGITGAGRRADRPPPPAGPDPHLRLT